MNYGRYNWSHLFLSAGLGLVFVWIGQDMLRHPDTWIGYIPINTPLGLDRETALKLSGIFNLAIGGLLVLRKWPKIIASLAAIHLIGVLITQGIDAILIRDVGLLGAALSLLAWPKRHHRSHNAS